MNSISLVQWLNMWGRLTYGSAGLSDFPCWVQTLPGIFFRVIDKDGNSSNTQFPKVFLTTWEKNRCVCSALPPPHTKKEVVQKKKLLGSPLILCSNTGTPCTLWLVKNKAIFFSYTLCMFCTPCMYSIADVNKATFFSYLLYTLYVLYC